MVTDTSPTTTTDSVPNGNDGGGVINNSPLSHRRSLPSPWASIVRGDSDQNLSPASATIPAAAVPTASAVPAPSSSPLMDSSVIESSGSEPQQESAVSVNGEGNDPALPKRAVWNRTPVNGVVEPPPVVMGGTASWPTLSEVRAVIRTPSDTPRPVSDGSAALSQAPLISQPPQRPATTNNAHGNSNGNNSMSNRPRSRNRGGGSTGSGPSHNTFNQPAPPMPPPFPVFEVPYPMNPMIPAVVDSSVRGARPTGGVGASQSHTGNDHSSQRNNSRRGGYGPRSRGDGPYHNNHSGRRDQDRRDVHPPPQYMPPPMGYMPPPPLPPGAAPYMAPPPMRVYGPQMGFDMTPSFIYGPPMGPESFRAMSMVPPLPPMIFPPPNENPLTSSIVKQIDFYFSDDNLVRDIFLRENMDDQCWVPITLVANFPRVQLLTKDIPLILDSLRYSTVVEVQGDKIRRRNDWSKWPRLSSGSRTPSSAPEIVLATSLREVSLDDATNSNGNVDKKEGHSEIDAGVE